MSRIQNIKTANIAHTNLAIFASIVNLLEGNYLVVEPQDADQYIEEGMVRENVFMTRDQFERLPEF